MRWLWMLLLMSGPWGTVRGGLPPEDLRTVRTRDAGTPRFFEPPADPVACRDLIASARARILTSAGLDPLPRRTPLEARRFSRFDGDGYTVETVLLQPWPGVFLGGNLYRPRSGLAPFPAVLLTHDHLDDGRLAASADAGIPGVCIALARSGCVVFAQDLIGYGDTVQFSGGSEPGAPSGERHRKAFRDPAYVLWNLNLLGQQLWNSLCAVDFVAGLDDVDPERIGAAGIGTGGLQTILLAAVDDRIRVTVPLATVSHLHQGSCECEQAPGLRLAYDNAALAAATAPRPQLLAGSIAGLTLNTPTIEGPSIARVYHALGTTNRFRTALVNSPPSGLQAGWEVVVPWMFRWLHGRSLSPSPVPVTPAIPPVTMLRGFPDNRPRPGALSESDFAASWIAERQRLLAELIPTDAATLDPYLETLMPLRERLLGAAEAHPAPLLIEGAFGREGRGDRVERLLLMPGQGPFDTAVVLVHPTGRAAIRPGGDREGFAIQLLEAGIPVLAFDLFQTRDPDATLAHHSPLVGNFTTDNRTLAQERVHDILAAIAYMREVVQPRRIVLVGDGMAGWWTLLAAPAADAVVADAEGRDWEDDAVLLAADRLVPGIRLIGGADGAASLTVPRPLWIHHTAGRFPAAATRAAYGAADAEDRLTLAPEPAGERALLRWILKRATSSK
ncbi:MAG: hypothetical protein KF791_12835 [Verrucomicrobiae bacterium]|nr:hypothetical protein [Verrucomicrobiae bacterium]